MVRQESAKLLCVGSIPTLASKSNCPGDGIGRRNGLKIRGLKSRVGSSPTPGTRIRLSGILSMDSAAQRAAKIGVVLAPPSRVHTTISLPLFICIIMIHIAS